MFAEDNQVVVGFMITAMITICAVTGLAICNDINEVRIKADTVLALQKAGASQLTIQSYLSRY